MDPNKKLTEWIGWIGVVLIVSAYITGVLGTISATDWRYLLINILGSAGIVYSSWRKQDRQPMILNIIWILVAILGLLRRG